MGWIHKKYDYHLTLNVMEIAKVEFQKYKHIEDL
jgi:hypothetical protein